MSNSDASFFRDFTSYRWTRSQIWARCNSTLVLSGGPRGLKRSQLICSSTDARFRCLDSTNIMPFALPQFHPAALEHNLQTPILSHLILNHPRSRAQFSHA